MGSSTNWGRDYGGTAPLGAATSTKQDEEIALHRGTLTDRSGTITTGGTAQNAMAANTSRKYASVTNPISATESLFVNDAGTATAGGSSYELLPGDSWPDDDFVPTNAISVYAATTGHAFIAREA